MRLARPGKSATVRAEGPRSAGEPARLVIKSRRQTGTNAPAKRGTVHPLRLVLADTEGDARLALGVGDDTPSPADDLRAALRVRNDRIGPELATLSREGLARRDGGAWKRGPVPPL